MIEFVQGDVFSEPVIAHGCNCRGIMGAGVAAQIRARFPAECQTYRITCEAGGLKMGEVLRTGNVFHLATQHDPGPHAQLWAIEACAKELIKMLTWERTVENTGTVLWPPKVVAMPRIGCGIGGLRWSDVSLVLRRVCERSRDVVVRVYEWGSK